MASQLKQIAIIALAALVLAGPVQAKGFSDPKYDGKALCAISDQDQKMLENVQKNHFQYFAEQSDAETGLTKDRSRDGAACSIAAVGFSLTAYGIAVDHKWISREAAADYTLKVLRTFWNSRQSGESAGVAGYHGFYYHFLDCKKVERVYGCELSTIDTALLMTGALYSRNYFNGASAKEIEIRDLATRLFERVDWQWAKDSALAQDQISMGWTPEKGFLAAKWKGYDEAAFMLIMAMGAPKHGLSATLWPTYFATGKIGSPYGHRSMVFGPMFGHQYTQCWIDLRGLHDATTEKLGFDFFENSRQATLAQHDYAVHNPRHWRGYSNLDWGLTACDGPGDFKRTIGGRKVQFYNYIARGFPNEHDDGTIAPTAAAASLPFAPEFVLPTLRHWLKDRPEICTPIGFTDAFNPTFEPSKPSGWVDPELIGIDQGPILLMIENFRTGSVWRTMKDDPDIKAGLVKAGLMKSGMAKAGIAKAGFRNHVSTGASE